MIDRAVGEATAHRQAGVPSTDNDCGDCANGARSQSSAVIACAGSIYYHRNIRGIGHDVVDCRSFLRLRDESLNIFALCISVYLVGSVTLMPPKPLRTSSSTPRMPRASMSPSIVAVTERNWMLRCWATAAIPAVRQL